VLRRVWTFCRENPGVTAFMLVSTVGGMVAGWLLPFDDLSLTRRLVGGAIAGFYFGLFPLGVRLFD